jgi:8-oxo-dGTP diphosphatase
MSGYLTTGRAAAALGVSAGTLRNWVRAGLVAPAFRTPRRGDMRWDLDNLRRQLEDGPQPPPREEVPVPQPADKPQQPAVIAAVVTSRAGVLAGRRNDGKPPWTFIAGESEPGESPADTITREVKEETGLLIHPGLTIGQRVHPKTGRLMVYVAAKPATRSKDVFVGDEDELAEVRWLTLREADELMPGMFPPVRQHLGRVLTGTQARGTTTVQGSRKSA